MLNQEYGGVEKVNPISRLSGNLAILQFYLWTNASLFETVKKRPKTFQPEMTLLRA
jgi:hypothetical protein